MNEPIGQMAGQIWNHLNANGQTSVAKLKTALKADTFVLNAALGWLAREEKVSIAKKGNAINVVLK